MGETMKGKKSANGCFFVFLNIEIYSEKQACNTLKKQ